MSQLSSKTKIILVPAILVGVLLTLAVALPFIVDLEKFRPQIQAGIQSAVNAEVDFKSIRLHAFPKLGITIKDLEVKNTAEPFAGKTLLKSGEIFVATEFWPLLSGKVAGELRIERPEIHLAIKNQTNNLAKLAKANPQTNSTGNPTPSSTKDGADTTPINPAMASALRERVLIKSVAIQNAKATATTEGKPLAAIQDFDLTISNIGLDRDIATRLTTRLTAKHGDVSTGGIVTVNLNSNITTDGGSAAGSLFKGINLRGDLDFTDLSLNFSNILVKKPGQTLKIAFGGAASQDSLRIDQVDFEILNISGKGKVVVDNFSTLKTNASLQIKSPDVSSLAAMLPQHAAMLQKATLDLALDLDGMMTNLATTKANVALDTHLNGSDLDIKVAMTGLLPAKGNISVASNQIDAAALLKPFMATSNDTNPANKKDDAPKENQITPITGAPAQVNDLALSKEVQDAIKPHSIGLAIDLKKVTWDRLVVKNTKISGSLQNLVVNLAEFSLQTLGGIVSSTGKLNLAAAPVAFDGTFNLTNVSASEAINVVAPAHKDALKGVLTAGLQISASGTTIKTLSTTLSGQGNYSLSEFTSSGGSTRAIASAAFDSFVTSLATGKSAEKAFQNIDKFLKSPVGQKIPESKRPKITDLKQKLEKIKTVKIPEKYAAEKKSGASNGKIEIKQGKIRIKSDTKSDLGVLNLDATTSLLGELSGTANLELSETEKNKLIQQSEYITFLLDQDQSLKLPFTVGGTATNPKLAMVTGELSDRFEKNATAKLEQEAKKALSDAGNQALKDSLKKAGVSPEKEAAIKKGLEDAKKKLGPKAEDKLKSLFKRK